MDKDNFHILVQEAWEDSYYATQCDEGFIDKLYKRLKGERI